MNQRNNLLAFGRNFTRFFQYALAALMLTALSGAALAEKVNLNTADAQALQYIPGIGPGKSADIIRVREEIDGFKVIEDLLVVPGIGEKTLIDIKRFGSLDSGVETLTEEMEANPPTREADKDAVTSQSDGQSGDEADSGS